MSMFGRARLDLVGLFTFAFLALEIGGLLFFSPGKTRADLPPPPFVTERNPRSEEIDAVMHRLKRGNGLRVRVTYCDTAKVVIAIPKRYQSAAERAGVMSLAEKQVMFAWDEKGLLGSNSFRTAVAGVALSVSFLVFGIWLARGSRQKLAAALGVVMACLACTVCVIAYFSHTESLGRLGRSAAEAKVQVGVTLVDGDGPVEIAVPLNLKPSYVGSANVIEDWGSRPARPDRFNKAKDKNK